MGRINLSLGEYTGTASTDPLDNKLWRAFLGSGYSGRFSYTDFLDGFLIIKSEDI